MIGWKNYNDMLSRFHTIPACHGQTDGQTDRRTDRITISISRVSSSMLTRDKNYKNRPRNAGVIIENISGCFFWTLCIYLTLESTLKRMMNYPKGSLVRVTWLSYTFWDPLSKFGLGKAISTWNFVQKLTIPYLTNNNPPQKRYVQSFQYYTKWDSSGVSIFPGWGF